MRLITSYHPRPPLNSIRGSTSTNARYWENTGQIRRFKWKRKRGILACEINTIVLGTNSPSVKIGTEQLMKNSNEIRLHINELKTE